MNEDQRTTELTTYTERRELAIQYSKDPWPWLIRSLQEKHQKQTEEGRRKKESGKETS
jgi:hypothetical protein